jgi:hypothetical protein
MKKQIFNIAMLNVIIIMLASCASSPKGGSFYKNQLNEINQSNGIDGEEAIIIAQNELIKEGIAEDYHLNKPRIEDSDLLEESWFVKFYLKWEFGYTLERLFLGTPWYGFYIDKKTGAILKKESWYPDL